MGFVNDYISQKAFAFPFLFNSPPTVIATKLVINNDIINGWTDFDTIVSIRNITTSSFVAALHSYNALLTQSIYSSFQVSWIAVGF